MPLILFSSRKKTSAQVLDLNYDPYWDNVVLLMHMDGANNSSSFIDEKGHAVTDVGGTLLKSAAKAFGTTSAYFSGTTHLEIASSSDFSLSSDFTIETWAYVSPANQTYDCLLAFDNGWYFQIYNGYFRFANASVAFMESSAALPTNAWIHIAVCRSGNTLTLYINGNVSATTTNTGTLGTTGKLYIGQNGTGYKYDGYLDEIRITKGVARYTSAFSVPTSAFPTGGFELDYDLYWDKVVLRMDMEGANNATTFVEQSTGKTVNKYGTPVISNAQSKFGSTSLYFPGGSSVYLADSDDWYWPGDYTIEFWFNAVSVSGLQLLIGQGSGTSVWTGIVLSAGVLKPIDSAGNYVINYGGIVANTWYHVAMVRSNNTLHMYLNGKRVGIVADATAPINRSMAMYLGGTDSYAYFNGYIDDVRITKGVARYLVDFNVPSKALPLSDYVYSGTGDKYDPYWNQTVLAMPMQSLTDLKGNAVTVINPSVTNISTDQKLFNSTGSLKNGLGSGLITSTIPMLGTGDFTIESWFYVTSWDATYYSAIFDSRADNSNAVGGMFIGVRDTHAYLTYSNGTGTTGVTGTAVSIPSNTWHHIAVTRANGISRLFINGVIVGSPGVDNNNYNLTNCKIGCTAFRSTAPGTSLVGYIQDFRVTKGKARYTTNFNVPTEPFPIIGASF